MIRIENVEVVGWDAAIRGMRNPMNSWDKSDSEYNVNCDVCNNPYYECENCPTTDCLIGPNDYKLMMKLRNAGTDHRKFMRMITVYVDITAPLYWLAEADTYKVGTVRNSCSKMHKIHDKEFTISDFSCEHMKDYIIDELNRIIILLNGLRADYLSTKDKSYWYSMIQLLPESYNQRSTLMLNYEVLANIYHARKNHKLDCWRTFCKWIETLPYSEIITGAKDENRKDDNNE